MPTSFGGRRPLLAFAALVPVLGLALGAGEGRAQGETAAVTAPIVPDLMDLPAAANPRATQMLQLSIARAGQRLVSVGEGGIVLLSDDGGANWRQATSVPVSVTLTEVAFADEKQGWAIGHSGVVLHSADGGETWGRQLDGNGAARAVLAEAEALKAAGNPAADAALRNANYMIADGPDKPFLGISFIDDKRGWIVGAYGLALETRDGGASWQSIAARIPNKGGKHLYAVAPLDGGLVVAGEQGALFAAPGLDAAFTAVESPYDGTFFGLLGLQGGGLLAYGLKGNAWRADAGLADWRRIDLGADATVTAGLRLADGSLLLGDEGGRLLRSTDEGASFVPMGSAGGTGLTAVRQAADGAFVVAGPRGNHRIDSNPKAQEAY
ncbi:WD40/YVTN/BNR-like repeat-containing protein [Zavarzinia aquatilis]|uniref:Glycosyl hydrolase n=1 Tax=Zavarzinia aquatilis TaxID=2211142 RepID=A0A317E098_9PROT|nr:YCF48-related protein [Zavarzinia aquatilis]PWR19530.1 glycosyl hydrolase [Zavarzinia aquatilis]